MEPLRALLLLLLLLLPAQALAQGSPREERLCGRELVRAVLRACGSPRWSREKESELHGGRERAGPLPDLQPLHQDLVQHRRRRREAPAVYSLERCCRIGCTRRDLHRFCVP